MDCIVDLPSSEVAPLPLDTSSRKTTNKYNNAYNAFIKWQTSNGITSFDEEDLLSYFIEKSEIYKSSSLWCMYAMLKSTIIRNNNIDISTYSRLIAFLKEKAVGFERNKYKVFSAEEVNKFLVEAPYEHYLAMKTILLFGVAGGCNGREVKNIKFDYVTDYGTEIVVKIPDIKKNGPNLFLISGEYVKIVQKYMQLRPANVMTDRFFIQYCQGECLNQVIGKEKIRIVPKEIAKFLKLDAYKSYTSLSFQSRILSNKLQSNEPIKPHTSKQLNTSTNTNSKVHNIIVMSQPESTYDVFYEITNLNEQQTETSSEPIMPMLPLTTALMKRKSKFYMGLPQNQFLHLLQLASEKKQLSDVKLMLALRKLRLNEEFEVLGDLFDLDKTTAEQYYYESKDMAIDLVALPVTTTSTSNHFPVISEPIIKIEESDTPYVPDPIGVTSDNYDSDTEMNVDDHDDFEFNLPISADSDRGYLSNDIRRKTAQCSVCHKFYVERLLNSHMESVHFNILNLNRTICGLCWKEFDTKVLLKTHQKEAHGGCCCACDVCGKLFSSKRYISVHILTKHARVKTYLCDICGEGFPVQSSLKAHVVMKHEKGSHVCHLCDMKFVTAAALKFHSRARHTHERPYKCEVKGCGKTFGWPSAFNSHKRVHAEDKYECSICLKRFSFKGNLQNHLKTVHNEIVSNNCLKQIYL